MESPIEYFIEQNRKYLNNTGLIELCASYILPQIRHAVFCAFYSHNRFHLYKPTEIAPKISFDLELTNIILTDIFQLGHYVFTIRL